MKRSSLFFIVMMSVQIISLQAFEESLSSLSIEKKTQIFDNPLFQETKNRDVSGIELGTLVFLGVGLVLIPVIRRSILTKLFV